MSKKSINHICDNCGNEHLITSSQNSKLISGKQLHSFCSIECKSLYQHNGKDIICENCGKEFYRRKFHTEINNHNFCSCECANEFRSKESKETRTCEQCNKEYITSKSSNQRFCSSRCNSDWQSSLIGVDNPKFTRKLMPCNNCGKMHYVKNYMVKNKNHFCSTNCRQKWYANVWCQQYEWKNKSRMKILETLSLGKISKTNSKPQSIINNVLDEFDIKYEREKIFEFYSIDNYLIDENLIIEVQGDYWHCNPIKNQLKISQLQSKNIRRDKAKNTYIHKYLNVNILYLWEYDILNNIEVCKKLIKEYISKNGVLKNYHSFNYMLIDNELVFVNNIVPYQEMKIIDYKDKIEKVS